MVDVIIIPTYNEKENIGRLLKIVSSILPSVSILVVDDNSPDKTFREVENLKKEIPNLDLLLRQEKEGLGKAYVDAISRVLADPDVRSVCTMDADFSHSPQFLSQMFQEIGRGIDVVVGSRYVKGGGIVGWPLWRKLLSRGANLYGQIFFHLPIRDCTSGFMCINAALLRRINLKEISASGFAFLVELKYALWKKGACFAEVPIIVENRKEGQSKITTGIILEGVATSWKVIRKDYSKKIRNFRSVVSDVLKKRGIFFIIYNGPKVFYCTFFKKKKNPFKFQGKYYNYFYRLYNCTCLNERQVEVPIVWEMVKANKGKKILEIGNVLSHYFNFPHDILDKYELADEVINQDVVDFSPSQKYDLIISISTLEHVGWDEDIKNPEKILMAINNLKKCLTEGGKMIVTFCLGYNPEIDKLLEEGKLGFTEQYFLKKISRDEWLECSQKEAMAVKYDKFHYTARGLAIGICSKHF